MIVNHKNKIFVNFKGFRNEDLKTHRVPERDLDLPVSPAIYYKCCGACNPSPLTHPNPVLYAGFQFKTLEDCSHTARKNANIISKVLKPILFPLF